MNWRRTAVPGPLAAMAPNARCWQREVDDGGHLSVLRTIERDGPDRPWRTHVSISHRLADGSPGRYPTWDEQREAVWRFAPGKMMASYLPPQESDEYVNVHPTTFHWWEVPTEAPRGGEHATT